MPGAMPRFPDPLEDWMIGQVSRHMRHLLAINGPREGSMLAYDPRDPRVVVTAPPREKDGPDEVVAYYPMTLRIDAIDPQGEDAVVQVLALKNTQPEAVLVKLVTRYHPRRKNLGEFQNTTNPQSIANAKAIQAAIQAGMAVSAHVQAAPRPNPALDKWHKFNVDIVESNKKREKAKRLEHQLFLLFYFVVAIAMCFPLIGAMLGGK